MRPILTVQVFDALSEKLGRGRRLVAEIESDGRAGRVVVHDPALRQVLCALFERPRHVMCGGQPGDPGGLGADALVTLAAFSRDAIEDIVEHGLGAHNLYGVLSDAGEK